MHTPYLTRDQVRAFDKHAIEQLGIPAAVLIENAGRGAAQVLQRLGIRGRVVIGCGKGNNGGDGLVIARHLANWGFDLLILLFSHPRDLSPDAALEWNITQRMGLPAQIWADENLDESRLTAILADADWIVDALFGTGLTGPVRPPLDRVIERINASGVRVLAIDIPSGLDCDTGEPLGACIHAAHTATFVAPKLGFQNSVAGPWTGQIHVVDIGIIDREKKTKADGGI
jgi:NAD(P)H-hydrate epimerase